MKKILNILVLPLFIFCFSLLNAATVNFPTDQTVVQKIELKSRKVNYNSNLSYKEMQTLLTLKEKSNQFWNLEAFYLEGWYGVPASEEVSLIKVGPDTFPHQWDIADITAYVSGTIGTFEALAYGYHRILDTHLAALWSLQERELSVGDSFTIKTHFIKSKYEILDINDENVVYSLKIADSFCPMEGVGFWNRKNGLVGQFHVDGLYKHENHFKFSSLPQE